MPSSAIVPPGLRRFSLRAFLRFTRDPLAGLVRLSSELGDAASFYGLFGPVVLLSDPDLVREVLVVKAKSFEKDRALRVTRRVIGQGLLTSEGELHRRQRSLAQPAFHRQRISSYGAQMVRSASSAQARWSAGEQDIVRQMSAITLDIVARTLFGSGVDDEIPEISAALDKVLQEFELRRMGLLPLLHKLPLPSTFRYFSGARRLDQTVNRFIAQRRKSGGDGGDLLSMLLLAQDSEGTGSMSDAQLRDEAMTIFLAGHETTAMALSWTWALLAQNPEVERALHAEVDSVLGGRPATVEDLPRLKYVEQVLTESMRIYPPAWIMGRRAMEDVEIGGWLIPRNTNVLMSQWVMHHDGRRFPEPRAFRPERWTPEFRAQLPRLAYFPFGAGTRICIGESFAWMEGILVLATLAQRWRFELLPESKLIPEPRITLRPKGGIQMRFVPRSAPASLRSVG